MAKGQSASVVTTRMLQNGTFETINNLNVSTYGMALNAHFDAVVLVCLFSKMLDGNGWQA